MTVAKKKDDLIDSIEKEVKRLLKEVMATPTNGKEAPSLTDKMKVIDRALKLAAVKAKMDDEGFGSGFASDN